MCTCRHIREYAVVAVQCNFSGKTSFESIEKLSRQRLGRLVRWHGSSVFICFVTFSFGLTLEILCSISLLCSNTNVPVASYLLFSKLISFYQRKAEGTVDRMRGYMVRKLCFAFGMLPLLLA